MKTLPTSPTNIKMKYNRGDANIVYTYALVKFPNTNSFLTLNPNKFKVSDNSYTENGGSNFPIGIALCKTIELNIDNTDGSLDEYTWQDWYGCKIYLFSRLTFIDDGTYYDLLEGVFYVTDIPNNLQFITIRASDFMLQTELSTQIYTQWSGAPATVTLWDYFVHICGELAVEIYGTGHSASEIYASHLSTDRFTNSTIELSSFAQDTSKNNNVTYRDILGYIAQLAGGNAIISYEYSGNVYTPKIDIREYDFTSLADRIISARLLSKQVANTIDAGELSDNITDILDCGNISETSDYIMLDKYIQHPDIQFADIVYTDVKIIYPITAGKDSSRKHLSGIDSSNELVLKNPILKDAPNITPTTIVDTLYPKLCNKSIRSFSGNYISQPLAEFMDNVIVTNRKGEFYTSFITSITYNYFGTSNIQNSVPTVSRNNSKYYNSWG